MAATMNSLVAELERSYAEAQERMSDPAVFSDRQAAAQAGRKLKDLEGPYKLAQEWRRLSDDVALAGSDPDFRDELPDLDRQLAELEEEL
jgi:hypothetical protein